MSKSRGLISGGDFTSRTSGMYDSADNIRLSHLSASGLKRIGIGQPSNKFSVGQTYPYSFAWSPDGRHFYISWSGDYIKHYECTSPFNLSGASETTFNVYDYESDTLSLEVSPNGRYLYFGGYNRDTANQFTMVNAWDISNFATLDQFNAGYEQQNKRMANIFSQGSVDGSVRGCEFNDDGTKFYLTGYGDDNVQQFSLSTAYDIGTHSYDGAYYIGGDGHTQPFNIRWNNDGTKFFVCNYSSDKIIEYSVSTAYDVTSTVTEEAEYSVSSREAQPTDVGFNADGTKMYVVGQNGDEINEWTLSTGFDLSSTITHVSATSLGLSKPWAFDFNPTGTKLVVIDNYHDKLRGWNLTTAFDTSTIGSAYETLDMSTLTWSGSPANSRDITNYFASPTGCRYNGDGSTITLMDMYDSSYDKAVSIPLTTAYDISSLTDGSLRGLDAGITEPRTIRFNPDGTKCYIVDANDDQIYQWSLAVPYALGRGSTASVFDGKTASLSSTDSKITSFDFYPDGRAIIVAGSYQDTIAHYNLSVPFDITSTLTFVAKIDITSFETDAQEVRIVNTPDGYKLHLLGTGQDKLWEMDINF